MVPSARTFRKLAIRNPLLLEIARCEGECGRPALFECHIDGLQYLCEPCRDAAWAARVDRIGSALEPDDFIAQLASVPA